MLLLKLSRWALRCLCILLLSLSVIASKNNNQNENQDQLEDSVKSGDMLYKEALKMLNQRNLERKHSFDPAVNSEEIEPSESGILSLSVNLIQNAIRSAFNKNGNKENDDQKKVEDEIKDPFLKKVTTKLMEAYELDHPDSIYMLGAMNLFSSYSHPRNITKAVNYFKKLSDLNGNHKAQHLLGIIYSTGIGGIEKDLGLSMLYHTFSARSDNPGSRLVLGYRYFNGISAPKSCNVALEYYKSAAAEAVQKFLSGPPGGKSFPPRPVRLSDFEGGVFGNKLEDLSNKGREAQQQGFNEVIEYNVFLSSSGSLQATYYLASVHYYGNKIVERNVASARKYLNQVMDYIPSLGPEEAWTDEQKRDVGNAYALLGLMYLRGEGVAVSKGTAKKHFEKGRKLKNPTATYWTAKLLLENKNDKKAYDTGLAYLTSAALALGDSEALVELGLIEMENEKHEKAFRYFLEAAKQKNFLGSYHLANYYANELFSLHSCTLAVPLFKSVAERGVWDLDHMSMGYHHYKRGEIETALIHYIIAAESGIEIAQENVAWIIDQAKYKLVNINNENNDKNKVQGSAIQPNYELALTYWTRSANQGNPDSRVKQGDYYFYGWGLSNPDYAKAAVCYQNAAEKHYDALAMWNIGWMYEYGIGLPKDFHLAKRWYDQSLVSNSKAVLPVNLSLFKLRIKNILEKLKNFFNGDAKLNLREILLSTGANNYNAKQEQIQDPKENNMNEDTNDENQNQVWSELHHDYETESHMDINSKSKPENYIILILCLFVGWLVYIRQFGMGNNNNRNLAREQVEEELAEDEANEANDNNNSNQHPQLNADPATGQA
ncbi:HCP-like protein [Neoconidiobolus thromboides FSU 785]|nr:HCP-like protein [Neoconidiobolus thromboides FSU 785]